MKSQLKSIYSAIRRLLGFPLDAQEQVEAEDVHLEVINPPADTDKPKAPTSAQIATVPVLALDTTALGTIFGMHLAKQALSIFLSTGKFVLVPLAMILAPIMSGLSIAEMVEDQDKVSIVDKTTNKVIGTRYKMKNERIGRAVQKTLSAIAIQVACILFLLPSTVSLLVSVISPFLRPEMVSILSLFAKTVAVALSAPIAPIIFAVVLGLETLYFARNAALAGYELYTKRNTLTTIEKANLKEKMAINVLLAISLGLATAGVLAAFILGAPVIGGALGVASFVVGMGVVAHLGRKAYKQWKAAKEARALEEKEAQVSNQNKLEPRVAPELGLVADGVGSRVGIEVVAKAVAPVAAPAPVVNSDSRAGTDLVLPREPASSLMRNNKATFFKKAKDDMYPLFGEVEIVDARLGNRLIG